MSSSEKGLVPESIPLSVKDWLYIVNRESAISTAVRSGAENMHIAQTTYSSGSKIEKSEFLHLRGVWYIYPGLDTLDSFYRNAVDGRPYLGYVSKENDDHAAVLFARFSSFWKRYLKNLEDQIPDLTTDIECGGWDTVLSFQAMVRRHVKEGNAAACRPKVFKDSYKPDSPQGSGSGTGSSLGAAFENLKICDVDRNAGQVPGPHDTPKAAVFGMAQRSELNQPSVDEIHTNMALLLLLEDVRKETATAQLSLLAKSRKDLAQGKLKEAGQDTAKVLDLYNWILPRLGLRLRVIPSPAAPQVIKPAMGKLMEAQVDGYLCRRIQGYDFQKGPLAICEVKPCVRTAKYELILRQETAEMACWIAEHAKKPEGHLQASAEGTRRRLLISQDRHEIYIIIGEYGPEYEDYIRGHVDLLASAPRAPASGPFDTEANQRAATGSASYNDQARVTGADKLRVSHPFPGSDGAPARGGMALRSQDPRVLPSADQFLIMHQFGPFLTTDAKHMERLVRRLIGFMLQLDANIK